MKPIRILHGNMTVQGVDVVVEIELNNEDKNKIHDLHIKNGLTDYDVDDVSFLVWIYVDRNGNIEGYSFNEASYYPAEQGEHYYENELLPRELENDCIKFVKENPGYEIN